MKSIINYFVPNYESTEKETRNRAVFLVYALLVIIITTVLLLPYQLFTFETKTLLPTAISSVLTIFTLLYFKKTQHLERSISLFALSGLFYFFYMIIMSGGINSPFIIWLTAFPPVAILIRSRPTLILNAVSCGLFLIALVILNALQIEFPNEIIVKKSVYNDIITVFTLGIFITLIVFQYDKTNQRYNEQLAQSNRELERFAYITSHDMKEPLRNIISFSQLLKRRAKGKLNENESDYLNIISNNAKQLHELIEDVLEFSRINRDVSDDIEEVDLKEVINEVIYNLDTTIKEKNAAVIYNDLPKIKAVELHLMQLFQNLIENGIKYNTSDNPSVDIKVEEDYKNFNFYLKDNGIGIEEEYQERIFEMFKRLHTREEYQGTGIGLALCKKIAQKYNGDLIVDASSSEGTTFKLTLPKVWN